MCADGCFPQTWEDPQHVTPDTQAAGDNDPIDAMEIGTQIHPTGAVVRVKVLGCLAMIDDGETDWKVRARVLACSRARPRRRRHAWPAAATHGPPPPRMARRRLAWPYLPSPDPCRTTLFLRARQVLCIATNDPLASQLNDIDDVERVIPGLISTAREWLRNYKLPDGKPPNAFGLDERAMDKAYTMEVVKETHDFWQGDADLPMS